MLTNTETNIASKVEGSELVRRVSGRLPRARRLEDIERAARKVFSMRGFAAASIAEIAAEAGVAEGTIYKFFESKRHLVARVIEVWYDGMLAEFERNLPGILGARAKIRFIIWRHLYSLKESPDLARLCNNEARNSAEYYQSELHDFNRRYTHVFLEACREGIASGELRPDISIPLVRDLVFGGIDHLISGMLYGRGDINPDQAADAIIETIFSGIGNQTLAASANATPEPLTVRLELAAKKLEDAVERFTGNREASA